MEGSPRLISFHSEHSDFELEQGEKYIQWVQSIADAEKVTIAGLSYIFCDDEYLLDINKTYLGHDYFTDIITFPYQQGDTVESDIFISIDRVKENALSLSIDFQNELLRVMAHGLLHLIGYGDKEEEEVLIMRQKEDLYITKW